MKISLQFLDQLQGISDWSQAKGYVRQQFEDLASQIQTGWNTEHNTDGTHAKATVTTDVVATGDISTLTGIGSFGGQPRAYVKINPNLTLANNVETPVTWATPDIDGSQIGAPDSGWNIAAMFDPVNPTRFTAPVDGTYLLNYSLRFTGSAVGQRYAFITVHVVDNSPADLGQCIQGGTANSQTIADTLVLPMRRDDYVVLSAYQNSGGNLDVIAGFLNSWFQITKIG